jgi:hypothetical protein
MTSAGKNPEGGSGSTSLPEERLLPRTGGGKELGSDDISSPLLEAEIDLVGPEETRPIVWIT